MFDDIVLFINIVQCRGLAAAAKQLQLPAATVTRRLQKLENSVGCQLIHRSARQFKLTADGEIYYQAYAELTHQLQTTAHELDKDTHKISGRLKVLAPTNISNGILQPMWSNFLKTYPEIQLNLELSNKTDDLLMSQADIALRIGPQSDSNLYQKRLGSIATVLVAGTQYIQQHGEPKSLEDLSQHRLISITAMEQWHLKNRETLKQKVLQSETHTVVSDVSLASQMACDDLGIALLPMSEIIGELESHHLIRVLPQWQGPAREIFAIWPSGRLLTAKAKCLRDFMQDFIKQQSVLQGMS